MSGESRTYAPQLDKSMGGRSVGSEVTRYDDPQHYLTIRKPGEWKSVHADHFVDAQTALTNRVARLKTQGLPHKVDGLTITYTDNDGTMTVLSYQEAG